MTAPLVTQSPLNPVSPHTASLRVLGVWTWSVGLGVHTVGHTCPTEGTLRSSVPPIVTMVFDLGRRPAPLGNGVARSSHSERSGNVLPSVKANGTSGWRLAAEPMGPGRCFDRV